MRGHMVYPVMLLVVLGCGAESNSKYAPAESVDRAVVSADEYGGTAPVPATPPSSEVPARKAGAVEAAQDLETPPATARKIVYNAQLSLVVEDLTGLAEKIRKLVEGAGGYLSSSDESSYTAAQRHATWTARVPVEKFPEIVAALGRFGEIQQERIDSQDVTQEFYDIEARIKNKQEEEKRLLRHLEDSTGKLEDILAVERELTRVRGEIEQMQGRIRYLANVSSLSTITISATEIHDYVPPVKPTFGTEIARTFEQSLNGLLGFVKMLTLVVVALVPWLPVVIVLVLLALLVVRATARTIHGRIGRQQP